MFSKIKIQVVRDKHDMTWSVLLSILRRENPKIGLEPKLHLLIQFLQLCWCYSHHLLIALHKYSKTQPELSETRSRCSEQKGCKLVFYKSYPAWNSMIKILVEIACLKKKKSAVPFSSALWGLMKSRLWTERRFAENKLRFLFQAPLVSVEGSSDLFESNT